VHLPSSCIIAYLVCYFLLRGYKAKRVEMEAPKPFTTVQKKTLAVLLAVMLANMLPLILYFLWPCNVTVFLKDHCNIQFWSIVGAIACMVLKLGVEKEIIEKKIDRKSTSLKYSQVSNSYAVV